MRKAIAFTALSLVFTSANAACGSGDELRPLDKIANDAEALLVKRDFVALDKLVANYRHQKVFASDGQPKLMGFYAGVSRANWICRLAVDSEAQWAVHRQLLADWGMASPKSAAPKLAEAKFQNAYGWKARGGGYASTVSEEGWRLFHQRTAEAQQMLEKLEILAKDDPEWYSTMLDTALSQSWSAQKFDALYGRAVTKFPYYFQYYFIKGAFYSAKWHGSQDKFKAFVEEVVKATEPELGQTMYACLHWSGKQDDMFSNGQTDWKRMRQGFEKMTSNFPDPWNRNHFGRFACMAGDFVTVREQLDLIGTKVIIQAWGDRDFLKWCKDRATSERTTGPTGK